MKKFILAAALVVFSGCGGGVSDNATAPVAPTKPVVAGLKTIPAYVTYDSGVPIIILSMACINGNQGEIKTLYVNYMHNNRTENMQAHKDVACINSSIVVPWPVVTTPRGYNVIEVYLVDSAGMRSETISTILDII